VRVRRAGTAMNNSLAPTSIPAASGCNTGKFSVFFLRLVAMSILPFLPVGRPGCERKQTPNRDRRRWRRHHKTVRNPGPMLTVGLQNRAPMSARAVAVVRPAPSSCLRRRFLVILSGLEASCMLMGTYFRERRFPGCAGLNRHVVAKERVVQERSSESILAPNLAVNIVRCGSKRRSGYRWAGLLSFEKRLNRVPTRS
jgi:hypothetical protein